MTMTFPFEAKLRDETPVQFLLAGQPDAERVRRLFALVVAEGNSYPHEQLPSDTECYEYWFRSKSTVVVYEAGMEPREAVLGAFYLRPNWPGRARHVANAGFIVAPEWRGKGLGWLLGAVMLQYAKDLGYRSVIFNLVFSENTVARRLWKELGFRDLGVIPGAVRDNKGSYQDAFIMWKSLLEDGHSVLHPHVTG